MACGVKGFCEINANPSTLSLRMPYVLNPEQVIIQLSAFDEPCLFLGGHKPHEVI